MDRITDRFIKRGGVHTGAGGQFGGELLNTAISYPTSWSRRPNNRGYPHRPKLPAAAIFPAPTS
jgi:hypothetical protein